MDILSKAMNIIYKKKKSSTDMKNLVMMIRNHELNMSDITVEYGTELIKKNKKNLGTDCKSFYIYKEKLETITFRLYFTGRTLFCCFGLPNIQYIRRFLYLILLINP